jgi:hypothetical protein
MSNLKSLQDHKEKRKLEVIQQDLDTVLYLLKLIKSGLADYSIYTPVRDIYISITNNQKILEKHLEKINVKLEKIYDNKQEG